MYIITSYNLCSISIHSMAKFKCMLLLCTHVYSYVLRKVHPPPFPWALLNIIKIGLSMITMG